MSVTPFEWALLAVSGVLFIALVVITIIASKRLR